MDPTPDGVDINFGTRSNCRNVDCFDTIELVVNSHLLRFFGIWVAFEIKLDSIVNVVVSCTLVRTSSLPLEPVVVCRYVLDAIHLCVVTSQRHARVRYSVVTVSIR